NRLRAMIDNHGAEETFFQELAAALGYKQNKLPFTLLAPRLPLSTLRSHRDHAESLFFGLAGFLKAPDLSVYESGTREYVRSLWHHWWPYRDGFERLALPSDVWRLSGARPLNHPQRRLAALAQIVREWPAVFDSLGAPVPSRAL